MWNVLNGTIVNALTVFVGSTIGVAAGARIPERYRTIVLSVLGLVTITLGVDAGVLEFSKLIEKFRPLVGAGPTYGARLAMVMISAMIIGSIIGTALRIQDRVEGLGASIHKRFSRGGSGQQFAEGFLSASVLFCVGPLTLLGCLENGANADPSFLYIKSALDAFASLALAATLGWGVFASIITVVTFQGGLSLLAYYVSDPLDELSLGMMTVTGGIMLLGTGFVLLDIKRIPVANMLPALFLPPLFIWLVERISPGLLLPLHGA